MAETLTYDGTPQTLQFFQEEQNSLEVGQDDARREETASW